MQVTTLNRIIAALLGVVAAVVLVVAVWNAALQATLFNPDTIKNALDNEQIYTGAVPVLIPAIAEAADAGPQVLDINEVVNAIGAEHWQAVTNELVPPDWLKTQTEHAIDALSGAIQGDPSGLRDAVDTAAIEQRLNGPAAERAVNVILDGAPPCTGQQNAQIQALAAGQQGQLPICNPPPELRPASHNILTNILHTLAARLSDVRLTFGRVFNVTTANRAESIGIAYDLYSQLGSLLFLFPVGLLALIVILAVRTLKSFGRWIGWSALGSGILALVPLVFVSLIILQSFGPLLNATSAVDQFLAQISAGLLRSILSQISGIVLIQVAVLGGVGLILLIVSVAAPAASLDTSPVSGKARRTVTVPDA